MGKLLWGFVGLSLVVGCGGLLRFQSESLTNLSLMPGTQSDDLAWTDGDPSTSGSPALEAYVVLAEPHAVKKVVVHTSELLAADLFAWDVAESGWVAAGSRRNGPGVMTFNLDEPTIVAGVRVEARGSTADEPVRLALWDEAYAQNYEEVYGQVESHTGRAYLKALARYGFRMPRPAIDPAKEADLQARGYADDAVAVAKREGVARAPALIEEIEVLGP